MVKRMARPSTDDHAKDTWASYSSFDIRTVDKYARDVIPANFLEFLATRRVRPTHLVDVRFREWCTSRKLVPNLLDLVGFHQFQKRNLKHVHEKSKTYSSKWERAKHHEDGTQRAIIRVNVIQSWPSNQVCKSIGTRLIAAQVDLPVTVRPVKHVERHE